MGMEIERNPTNKSDWKSKGVEFHDKIQNLSFQSSPSNLPSFHPLLYNPENPYNPANPASDKVQTYPSDSPQKFDRFNRHEISQNRFPTLLQHRFPVNFKRLKNSVIFCGICCFPYLFVEALSRSRLFYYNPANPASDNYASCRSPLPLATHLNSSETPITAGEV